VSTVSAAVRVGSAKRQERVQLFVEDRVSDKRDQVEQGVGEYKRPDPAGTKIEYRKYGTHYGVADKGSKSLVQVVGTPK
jgi:hypothetical protein